MNSRSDVILPHKKFTWADFFWGGIHTHIHLRRYAPDLCTCVFQRPALQIHTCTLRTCTSVLSRLLASVQHYPDLYLHFTYLRFPMLAISASTWAGLNSGPVFRRLQSIADKVHKIKRSYAGQLAVCNAVFRLTMSCFVPKTGLSQTSCKGDGGGRGHVPPKIREKIFFGQLLCKIRAFFGQKSSKIREFCNFLGKYNKKSGILIIFRARIT